MAGANNGNSFAFLVGVGQRAEDHENMSISASDASHISKALINFLSFPPKNVVIKTNEGAGRQSILQELDNFAAATEQKQADLVIIYFSGHGCSIGDNYYLICNDTPNNAIATGAIEGKAFVEKLNKINAAKMIVLLDCCHSQGLVERSENIPFDETGLLSKQNRVVITACGREQVSYLCDPVSLFTYALIEGLLGHCFTTGDTVVKIFQLALYIRERTATLSAQVLGGVSAQKMQMEVLPDSGTANFIITEFPNGQPKKMPGDLAELHRLGGNKEVIPTGIENQPDNEFKQQFNWLSANNVQIDGDGNITAIGSNISITINSDTGFDELKELVKTQNELVKQIMPMISNTQDSKLKAIHSKVEISEIQNLLEQGSDKHLGEAIGSFLLIARGLPGGNTFYPALLILNADYKLMMQDDEVGLDIEQKRKKIMFKLTRVIEKYKSGLDG